MERIKEILERQILTNSSKENTGTWSSAEAAEAAENGTCPTCSGARFVYARLPSGKPDYSRVVPCKCTENVSKTDQQVRLREYSKLGPLTKLTFAALDRNGRSSDPASQEKFKRAYDTALSFADTPKGWLIIGGPSGSGKTHLAAAIANRRIENNLPAFYVTVPDLLDHLRSSFNPASETPFDEFFEQVKSAPLLVLDDLGVQSSTPWAKEKLDQLLNHRFSNQLPTVVVSIVPVNNLDERVKTRLMSPDFSQVIVLEESRPSQSLHTWEPEFQLQKQMTFESFDWKRSNLPSDQRENLKKAFDLAFEWAKGEYDGWLVLAGTNGCGKTHLAAAIVNYRFQRKQPAIFKVVPDLLDRLRSTFSPESKTSYDQYFEAVKSAPFLVLDDFGQQSTTPWAQEKMYQMINYRYNARLTTIITTTLSPEQLESGVGSRFVDPKISTFFNITAPDYRGDATRKRPVRSSGRGNAPELR